MTENQNFDPDIIYLTKQELTRFIEIANGNHVASNCPYEDTLFRYKLIKESMMCFTDTSTGITTADLRAVSLTQLGEQYYAWYQNSKQRNKRITILNAITITISLVSVILAFVQLFLLT